MELTLFDPWYRCIRMQSLSARICLLRTQHNTADPVHPRELLPYRLGDAAAMPCRLFLQQSRLPEILPTARLLSGRVYQHGLVRRWKLLSVPQHQQTLHGRPLLSARVGQARPLPPGLLLRFGRASQPNSLPSWKLLPVSFDADPLRRW